MEYPQRKHARYRWHDYNGGLYFITICVKDKKHLFGRIENHQITFTEIGEIAACHVQEIPLHWNGVKVISSVVMPNHVHLIIHIDGQGSLRSTRLRPRQGEAISVDTMELVMPYMRIVGRATAPKSVRLPWKIVALHWIS